MGPRCGSGHPTAATRSGEPGSGNGKKRRVAWQSPEQEVDRCCADRAPRFRPPRRGWFHPGRSRGWLCCRQSPEFAPVRLKEPAPGGCQGKKRGVGAGRSAAQDSAPNALTAARSRLRSRVRAGAVETGGSKRIVFDRGETPRGERECGAARAHI